MKLSTSSVLVLAMAGAMVANAQNDTTTLMTSSPQQTCDANPGCAALGLADDCCPTSLAGIFLDCCEQPGDECEANAGCAGLSDSCCPNEEGVFLYCCFEPAAEEAGYRPEYTYWADPKGIDVGSYTVSSGDFNVSYAAETDLWSYDYVRSASLFDIIYLQGPVVDAGMYLSGEKKFYLTMEGTTAPACTQVLLQFENVAMARESQWPMGRHSRYLGTITPDQTQIEFNFLDRLDLNVTDTDVNAVALFFDPGSDSTDSYQFSNLASHIKCPQGGEECVSAPTKTCPALYVQIAGSTATTAAAAGRNAGDPFRSLQNEGPDCSDCRNPACMGVESCNVDESFNTLFNDPNFVEGTSSPDSATEGLIPVEADAEDGQVEEEVVQEEEEEEDEEQVDNSDSTETGDEATQSNEPEATPTETLPPSGARLVGNVGMIAIIGIAALVLN